MKKMNLNPNFSSAKGCFLSAFVFIMISATVSLAQNVNISKNYYRPGESIDVKFSAPGNYNSSAWIGIIPSNIGHGSEVVNDQNDIVYQYFGGKTSGTLTFSAPTALGNYDFRMNDDDNGGHEVASVSFEVTNNVPPPTQSSSGMLSLQKYSFAVGEKIAVSFSVPYVHDESAWIGIVPSSVPHGEEAVNDQNDVAYQYLKLESKGTFYFDAPERGTWDLRLNSSDNSGKELASVTFTVGGGASNPPPAYNPPAQNTLPAPEGVEIFNNWNKAFVDNSSSGPTYFYISKPTTITRISNYHWNNGNGKNAGQIGLKGPDGRTYGPWNTVGTSGTGGAQNVNWVAIPNVNLYPGVYQILDSDNATWSNNAGSFGCGFSSVMGK
jgi:hypothetical protein